MKKSIPKVQERESEASILGNDREQEFPLTPGGTVKKHHVYRLHKPLTCVFSAYSDIRINRLQSAVFNVVSC